MGPEAAKFGGITQNNGHFAAPGYSRSPICAVASFQPNIGGSNISYTSYSTTSPSSLL